MHVINGAWKLRQGFSRPVVSHVGMLVSGRQVPLRDVIQHYIECLAYSILRARGGATAASLSRAATPARQLLYRPVDAGMHALPAPAVVADCLQQWGRVASDAAAVLYRSGTSASASGALSSALLPSSTSA